MADVAASNSSLYTREIRSITEHVKSIFARAKHTDISANVLRHIALLVMVLQVMSEIITFMIGDTHPFYTQERNLGLDTATLCAPVHAALLADARKPDNQTHEFWHSPDIERSYWGLVLQCMLDADEEAWRHPMAAQAVALSLRFRVVGPVVKRLLGLIRDVTAKCAPKSDLIACVRLRLLGLLRQPTDDNPEADIDPGNVIPRGLHNRQFAGAVDRLAAPSQAAFQQMGDTMRKTYGKAAAGAVLAAAELAGLRVDASYRGEPPLMDNASAAPLRDGYDCGVLLSTQLSLFQRLDDLLHYLDEDDEARTFDRVLKKSDAAVEDMFFSLPL